MTLIQPNPRPFAGMEPSRRRAKPSAADWSKSASPPVTGLLAIHDRGLIFESSQPFEVAARLQLGFHLPPIDHSNRDTPRFVTVEGSVVSCLLCASECGSPVYEIALLFESEEAVRALSGVAPHGDPSTDQELPEVISCN